MVKLFKNHNRGLKRCKWPVNRCMAKRLKRLVLRREKKKEKYYS